MKVTALYVGSSLLAPLRAAEREINREHDLDLKVEAWNFGATFTEVEWQTIESSLLAADVVFVIHVMDGENAARLLPILDHRRRELPVIVINCMPEVMKRTRLGKLDFQKFSRKGAKAPSEAEPEHEANSLMRSVASWVGRQTRNGKSNGHSRAEYLKWAERLPNLLRFVPNAGRLGDARNYLLLVSYFLQPTPQNIQSMILLAVKNYVDDDRVGSLEIAAPEALPAVAIYHPEAPGLFESFPEYENWYRKFISKSNGNPLDPKSTLGLLLMRPQIVSNSRKHYDALIRAIEGQGLSVIPAISTLMDNREASEKFFVSRSNGQNLKTRELSTDHGQLTTDSRARVSQIVSLTGFSFVGGPALNDSEAAAEYLSELNIPYRSLVSLDTQTIESWRESFTGLNPVQMGMQVAIPEIDGATEPFVFGGISTEAVEPAALEDRCQRIAARLHRWNRLQTAPRKELKLALALYCFPPNKGNIGTAADLDVFASVFAILERLRHDGYEVEVPASADALRELLLGGNSGNFATTANVSYQMSVEEYRRLCPFVAEIENEWGPAPGTIDTNDGQALIQGISLGNIFVGVQPTFGYEADPMRLLMSQGGTPHHGFAAFYTYLEKVFKADAVVHVGTHGALEFMPGKQVGLSDRCWPDRLIGELPNIYIYSVNNPSEGTIAKRRSYAELISYLTPPIENAGLYKELALLKEMVGDYRKTTDDSSRERLFKSIEAVAASANLFSGTD